MSSEHAISPQQALAHAKKAYRTGDRRLARHWSAYAASLAPHYEEPWIFLGALAGDKASVEYFKRALQINPQSDRAQKGLQLALQRIAKQSNEDTAQTPTALKETPSKTKRLGCLLVPIIGAIVLVSMGLAAWFGYPFLRHDERRSS